MKYNIYDSVIVSPKCGPMGEHHYKCNDCGHEWIYSSDD